MKKELKVNDRIAATIYHEGSGTIINIYTPQQAFKKVKVYHEPSLSMTEDDRCYDAGDIIDNAHQRWIEVQHDDSDERIWYFEDELIVAIDDNNCCYQQQQQGDNDNDHQ